MYVVLPIRIMPVALEMLFVNSRNKSDRWNIQYSMERYSIPVAPYFGSKRLKPLHFAFEFNKRTQSWHLPALWRDHSLL